MNKIICDVCGTDYPETAAQCPICGCASAGSKTSSGVEAADPEERAAYTPVKGGRYSKANVRKRLKANQVAYDPTPDSDPEPEYEDDEEPEETEEEEARGSNRGLIVVVIILLLAIVAVATYIAISIFGLGADKLPISGNKPGISHTSPTKAPVTNPTTEPTSATTGVACVGLAVSDMDIHLQTVGSVWQLTVTPVPADTTDSVTFASSDENVVTVSETGLVTAVGAGEASITVTCGNETTVVSVTCTQENTEPTTEPTEVPDDFVLKLLSKDFTLNKAGATFDLYDGEVDPAEITWTTDNEKVVTIDKGIVTAVGNGRTRVYGEYGDQKVSCWVSCKLPEEQATQPTDPDATEPGDADTASYKLLVNGRISRYGDRHNAEVTIMVGEEFRLTVEDENGIRQMVTWNISKEGICSVDDKTVTGEGKGNVTLTATIGSQTYTCIIHVK